MSVTVNANADPVVTITSPTTGSVFTATDPVSFAGSATDAEDGDVTADLSWSSDLDGALGTGGSFSLTTLSVGTHVITASVTDSHGGTDSTSVSVTVNANADPVVTLTSPTTGSVVAVGASVSFAGSAADPEDGDLSAALVWTSDLDGAIGSGASFSTAGLSQGTHTITASVADSHGGSGSASISLDVAQPVQVTLTAIAAEDGYVLESSENSDVGGSSNSGNKGRRSLRVGDVSDDRQYKTILSFDTSSLPAGATVLEATVRLRRGRLTGSNPFQTHGACRVDVNTGGFGGDTALASSDFQASATVTGAAVLSDAPSDGSWSEGSLNAAGRAAIDLQGTTQMRIAFDLDDNDDGGNDYMGYYAADNNNASNRPQLVVTYLP